jgi:hypothetical protein
MKYTGMAGEKVKEPGETLKKRDTRTARTELNAPVADAGRPGKKSKKDLLDFAEAGNVINVAPGEDLEKEAIKGIGKLSMMFGNANRMGLNDELLTVLRNVNAEYEKNIRLPPAGEKRMRRAKRQKRQKPGKLTLKRKYGN